MAWFRNNPEIKSLINDAVSDSVNNKLIELNKDFRDKCGEVDDLQ